MQPAGAMRLVYIVKRTIYGIGSRQIDAPASRKGDRKTLATWKAPREVGGRRARRGQEVKSRQPLFEVPRCDGLVGASAGVHPQVRAVARPAARQDDAASSRRGPTPRAGIPATRETADAGLWRHLPDGPLGYAPGKRRPARIARRSLDGATPSSPRDSSRAGSRRMASPQARGLCEIW